MYFSWLQADLGGVLLPLVDESCPAGTLTLALTLNAIALAFACGTLALARMYGCSLIRTVLQNLTTMLFFLG